MSEVAERIQEEVTEIAEVLSRRQGKPIREVWTEALSLHRVRYETKVLRAEEAASPSTRDQS
jgi:acyl-CoA reductase-like NAD-dependent aldehyde dehydrogenase